ncbi:MAG: hypothetical protein FWE64_03725 [Alphaproteobacteria bacterium]|nr:hypothetical protein [Alphaproteobacteria bacterium]
MKNENLATVMKKSDYEEIRSVNHKAVDTVSNELRGALATASPENLTYSCEIHYIGGNGVDSIGSTTDEKVLTKCDDVRYTETMDFHKYAQATRTVEKYPYTVGAKKETYEVVIESEQCLKGFHAMVAYKILEKAYNNDNADKRNKIINDAIARYAKRQASEVGLFAAKLKKISNPEH